MLIGIPIPIILPPLATNDGRHQAAAGLSYRYDNLHSVGELGKRR